MADLLTDALPPVTLDEQIAEVAREIELRKRVYPGFVARMKMDQEEAERHLERMRAVHQTLMWFKRNELRKLAPQITPTETPNA
jgi:phosphatidylserine decarboxylase